MKILDPRVDSYIASLIEPGDPILSEMEERAEGESFPIVGPQVGRFLEMMARFAGAGRILELGSGFGYSAYWFARALAPGGSVHCTDMSEENRDLALAYFRRAGLSDRMTFHVGDALELARTLEGPFDIVFNDIDKRDYPRSVEIAVALLRQGGLFITDNVLWDGRVAEDDGNGTTDETTTAIKRFNETVFKDSGLETVILPLRDGLAVCQKR